MTPRTAIVMMNLGGPTRLDEVEPFLANIFSDPDVIQFPWGRFGQRWIGRRMARARAPEARKNYALIGGASPLAGWMERQGVLLEAALGPGFTCYSAMRAWAPDTATAIDRLVAEGTERIVALPCYPHHSRTTTGSSMNELRRVLKRRNVALPLHVVDSYPLQTDYLAAWTERIREALATDPSAPAPHLLFSAHSLPKKVIDRGDRYLDQIRATAEAVMRPFASSEKPLPWSLAFQSRATRVEWLRPSTQEAIDALVAQGTRHLLVVPISFLTDHVETLFELDLLIRDHALKAGIETYRRVGSLNDSPLLIRGLAQLVHEALERSPA